ncbi:MAG: heat shock S4 protein [uncultured bacterium]|uniref:RNA-binding S4 domain-containing protein n=1 Tax=Candidatus Wallbacteria bacterium GWC2_49_35 TaxID=1817813 RepID=A0A1F7WDP2_9BACT|nr:MAG: heat shock S4 protein [uncultured bacterium]OGM00920.1 MAG: hypothetical protein A2008_09715 [Candidatus Wallbacteria bacterium GWC2_49_35]HBC75990.1 RNA-binding protein [Candidatus Wallbacteria bacterium]
MRLDKFLKLYRIIKRRTLAQEACDGGFVVVNGRPAKSGKELSENDEITVNFVQAGNSLHIKILKLRDGNVVSPDDISVSERGL